MKRFVLSAALAALACSSAFAQRSAPVDTTAQGQAEEQKAVPSANAGQAEPNEALLSALRSPKDQYGIPVGLYDYDSALNDSLNLVKAYQIEAISVTAVGGLFVGVGLAFLILAPGFAIAPEGTSIDIPFCVVPLSLGGFCLVLDVALILPTIARYKKALLRQYDERYAKM
jgi:hypothetical protein